MAMKEQQPSRRKATRLSGSFNGADLGDGLVSGVQTIGPEEATQWLKANRHNRPIRRKHVAFLAREIALGNWQLNGQAIIVSEDEEVLDGQHRLLAVIEAGVAIRTLVIYGVTKEAFKTIDTGAVRTGGDVLALHFPDHASSHAKVVSNSVRWIDALGRGFFGVDSKLSNTDILVFIIEHPEIWRYGETLLGYPKAKRLLSAACGVALFYYFAQKDGEKADRFMHRLYSGEDMQAGMPEYELALILEKDMRTAAKFPLEHKMKMAVKAWNLARRNRDDVKRRDLVIGSDEPSKYKIL